MTRDDIIERGLLEELKFSFSKSSGAGGQNVNKVNTKVELRFMITTSLRLSETEKTTIIERALPYINKKGELTLTSQETRSQLENKEICIEKFVLLIEKCTKIRIKRKRTTRSQSSIENRLKDKANKSEIKNTRKGVIDLGE